MAEISIKSEKITPQIREAIEKKLKEFENKAATEGTKVKLNDHAADLWSVNYHTT
jgi:hypothetical protein